MSRFDPVDITHHDDLLKLFEECKSDGEDALAKVKVEAERNERWFHGKQAQGIDPVWSEFGVIARSKEGVYVQNHLRNIVNTHKARMLKDRPAVKPWPASSDPRSIASARIANIALKSVLTSQKADKKDDRMVLMADLHTTAAQKICFHPDSDQVELTDLTIFDFFIDPRAADDDELANWVMFRSSIDPWSAAQMFKANQIPGDPAVEQEVINDGAPRDCVFVWEFWFIPCDRVPAGVYCKVIDKEVFDVQTYPYLMPDLEDPQGPEKIQQHEQSKGLPPQDGAEPYKPPDGFRPLLPIAIIRAEELRGSVYGDTFVNDTINEQRQINLTETALAEITVKTAGVKLITTDAKAAALLSEPGHKAVHLAQGLDKTGYLRAPDAPSLLFANREYRVKRMYDVAGLNDTLVGVENVKSGTSAKMLGFLAEQDALKHRSLEQSIETFTLRRAEKILKLVQYYYTAPRIARMAKDEGGFETEAFRGADMAGILIDLEPVAGRTLFHGAAADMAENDAANQWISPQQLMETRQTGSTVGESEQTTRQEIAKQVRFVSMGAQPQIDPSLDPNVAFDEISKIYSLLREGGAAQTALLSVQAFAQLYQQQLAAASAPPPQQGAAPAQPAPGGF